MTKTTRFPNGINNAILPSAFEEMGQLDPSRFHNYFNDFNKFNDGVPADWVVTTVEAGAGSASEVITDEDGGVLLITNDDADNDSDALQLVNETFKFEAGKKLFFKTRFKLADEFETRLIMGLQIRDTTPFVVTDGVFFNKGSGTSNLQFVVEKDSSFSITLKPHPALFDDTYTELAFFYNGKDQITAYQDDQIIGAPLATTNLPDDEELTISFAIQNAEAAAKTMDIDYIFVAKER